MNRANLVAKIHKLGVKKVVAGKILNEIFDAILAAAANGETVRISGFGSFQAKEYAERKGINPKTGDELTIKSRKVFRFKPFKSANMEMNKKQHT